jgi:hypothetical protein
MRGEYFVLRIVCQWGNYEELYVRWCTAILLTSLFMHDSPTISLLGGLVVEVLCNRLREVPILLHVIFFCESGTNWTSADVNEEHFQKCVQNAGACLQI